MGPRLTAVARHRIRIRYVPLVHAVATVKFDRWPQYKNTKPRRNLEIQPQTHAVNGIDALVTTPLRSVVTRAPSDPARLAPGICLSHGLHRTPLPRHSRDCDSPSVHGPRSTVDAERGLALGTRVSGSRCRNGQGIWTDCQVRFNLNRGKIRAQERFFGGQSLQSAGLRTYRQK